MENLLNNTQASCDREIIEYRLYSLQEFSALWCGASPDDVDTVLSNASPVGNSNSKNMVLLKSDDYPCLYPKMVILMNAIESGDLMACDETGFERTGIAWKRVHISGRRGRDWLKHYCKANHDELPRVFFPELEKTPPLADSLRVENKQLASALEAERVRCEALSVELEKVRQEAAQAHETASDGIHPRREHSYQLLIAGMLQEAVNHGKEGIQRGNIKAVAGYVDSVGGKLGEDAVKMILKESLEYAASIAKEKS